MSFWIPRNERAHHEFRRNVVDEAVAEPELQHALADGQRRTGLYQPFAGDVVSPFLALKPHVATESLVSPEFALQERGALRVVPGEVDRG